MKFSNFSMFRVFLLLAVGAAIGFKFLTPSGDSQPVRTPVVVNIPVHAVARSSLASRTGKRVQITVQSEISRNECLALIDAYRGEGAPDGQVSVHMPSNIPALQRSILPWCVENFDGQGIVFNTSYFQ